MSVKKEPSGRRSVQVEVEVPGSAQSRGARRSAEAQLRTRVAKFLRPGNYGSIGAMRRWLRKPACPPPMRWCMNIATGSSSAIHRTSAGTRAFLPSAERGTAFSCTSIVARSCRILRNCCRGPADRRSIDVEAASTLARPAIASLIDEAIARNPVPFALAGRGSVVMSRSTSAKQRRRRRPA